MEGDYRIFWRGSRAASHTHLHTHIQNVRIHYLINLLVHTHLTFTTRHFLCFTHNMHKAKFMRRRNVWHPRIRRPAMELLGTLSSTPLLIINVFYDNLNDTISKFRYESHLQFVMISTSLRKGRERTSCSA